MDITPFKDIITSFSSISNVTLAVWDRNEAVFSTPSDPVAELPPEMLRDFANQVLGGGPHQTRGSETESALIGVPIPSEDGNVGVLVAYGQNGDSGSQPDLV